MSPETLVAPNRISTLNEKSLHAALKEWYARPGDRIEESVDGFLVDIARDGMLIEIQTRNFSALKRKLLTLTREHPVRLVYPIALAKWIVRISKDRRKQLGRRKSPKHGSVESLFEELVSIPTLMAEANFSLEVLLIREEEVRRKDGARHWRRRGWATEERRLIDVVERRLFETPADLMRLVPDDLPEPFTTADLADAISRSVDIARQMAYCLREMGAFTQVGKRGNAILYTRAAG